jgi:hypothetical protein
MVAFDENGYESPSSLKAETFLIGLMTISFSKKKDTAV